MGGRSENKEKNARAKMEKREAERRRATSLLTWTNFLNSK
jgi:hypothetical protein